MGRGQTCHPLLFDERWKAFLQVSYVRRLLAYLTIHSSRVIDAWLATTLPVTSSPGSTLVNLLSKDGACCATAFVVASVTVNVINRRMKRFGEWSCCSIADRSGTKRIWKGGWLSGEGGCRDVLDSILQNFLKKLQEILIILIALSQICQSAASAKTLFILKSNGS